MDDHDDGERDAVTDAARRWWQHWQSVVALVVAGFGVGAALGVLLGAEAADDEAAAAVRVRQHAEDNASIAAQADRMLDRARRQHVDGGADVLPDVTLTVHSDGCGVIRPEITPEPDNLQWKVTDTDGFQVLGRNASGETRYRYFGSGTYRVVLIAWGGPGYVPISNEVTITC